MIHRLLFWFIILANLGVAVLGTAFQWNYLDSVNPLLWSMVLDLPGFAIMFAIAFFFRGESRPAILLKAVRKTGLRRVPDLSFFWFFAFAGVLKYGFWTVFVLMTYPSFFFTPEAGLLAAVMFGASLFVIFETMLMVGRIKVREVLVSLVLFSLIVNDLSDYLLGTHPQLPAESLGFMFPATLGMSVVFTLLSYLVLTKYSSEFRG
jgi:uncharacterized membrane protein YpjA